MERLTTAEELLKDYHQMKKKLLYIEELVALPIMETYEDTIEELTYKKEDFLQPARGP